MSKDLFSIDTEDIENIVDSDDIDDHTTFRMIPAANSNPAPAKPKVIQKSTPESFDEDFDLVRTNLKDLIDSGSDALTSILSLAKAGDQPRAYEVVATMIKELTNVNKELMEVHKKKQESSVMKVPNQNTNNTQNNTIFVGSTAELSKMMKKLKMQDSDE